MKDPVRNLLVYGDGRVQEVPFRLEGMYYRQTEQGPDGVLFHRSFKGSYATDGRGPDDGNFAMVYMERAGDTELATLAGPIMVNGTPIPVDVRMRERGWDARQVHKECRGRGGHRHDAADTCELCGLTGYVVRTMRYLDERDEKEAKEAAALRDQLVRLRDENKELLVENAQLRRRLEKPTRSGSAGK